MRHFLRPTAFKRMLFFVFLDAVLSVLTLYFSYALRFNFTIPSEFIQSFWRVYFLLLLLKIGAMYGYKLYFTVWRFFGIHESKNLVKAHVVAYGLFGMVYLLNVESFSPFPRSVVMIDFFLSLIFLGALRVSKRILLENRDFETMTPVVILGVGGRAATIIQSAIQGEVPYYPQAIVALSNDEMTHNTYIHNVKVYPPEALEEVLLRVGAEEAILAQSLPPDVLQGWVARLNASGIRRIKKVKLLGSEHERLEAISIEDLLARHPQDLDTETIGAFIRGKRILITGAGGSIGSEIVRQCHAFGASELVLVDNSEYNLYQIGEQIASATLHLVDISDRVVLKHLIEKTRPQIVLHAAAYKHVPLCEANPHSAVHNNVLGSKNVIDLSIEAGAEKLVIISTDKAVRPTNVMGATKRVVELYAANVDSWRTEIVAVRFGNVLGSSGSVIPKFQSQIERGGPVTVTHPEMTRYFMLIPEACQLVLQAAAIAQGGELFLLDMGEPVKIVDLARQMIRLYGKEDEIEVIFTGLRPGEKLYEELLIDEHEQKTQYDSILIARPMHCDISQLTRDMDALMDSDDVPRELRRIVPEYTPDNVEREPSDKE